MNIRQVKTLSGILLLMAALVRLTSFLYYDELASMPNFIEYNISNFVQIAGSLTFLLLSISASKSGNWTTEKRSTLTFLYTIFILLITFSLSYIFSLHNAKNTMTIFLVGVVTVSIFFSLEFHQVTFLAMFVIVLFLIGITISPMDLQEKIFNMIMSMVLAFVIYSFSRYGYFVKSQHFVQVRELEEKNEEVQQLNRQKGEILAFVAHDLRNPLNNIEGLSAIMLDEDLCQQTELRLILNSARHAKNIINDLIEVVQEEKAPLMVQNINLSDYLKKICNQWQSNEEGARKINFSTEDEELNISLNHSKFTRVMDNLIGNGLKFSRPDSPIDIELTSAERHCMISIRDYGIGIPEHLQRMLFDQFSKAGRPGLKGEKSIGLGLHISKQIIEQHGWTLTVFSQENSGTTFKISIPHTLS